MGNATEHEAFLHVVLGPVAAEVASTNFSEIVVSPAALAQFGGIVANPSEGFHEQRQQLACATNAMASTTATLRSCPIHSLRGML